jgi:hypothetical protein
MDVADTGPNRSVNSAGHAARLAGAAAAHLDPTPIQIRRRQLRVAGLENPVVRGGVAELTHEGRPLPGRETAHTRAQPVHAAHLGKEPIRRD